MARLGSALVAEAVGVFAFSFVGIMAIQQMSGASSILALIAIALAHGLMLSIVISAFGHISGGHINPAVTIGLLALKKITPGAALAYIVAQMVGGFLAGMAIIAVYHGNKMNLHGANIVAGGTPILNPAISIYGGLIAEIIATFFLMTAVLGTAVDPRAPKIGGFGIGLTVGCDILAIEPLTGAAMNPARAVGPAIAATICGVEGDWTSRYWGQNWVYWVGPIAGAVVAALIYKAYFSPEASEK